LNVIETELPGVLIIEPRVFGDDRGYFMETYHDARYFELAGIKGPFLQDNHSSSIRGVVRGLHYQEPNAQGKLVRATVGTLLDVAVDIRRGSPHFAKWVAVELSADNRRQLWIPPGFAHGFAVLSERADMMYKCTTLYDSAGDKGIIWNEPEIGIDWGIDSPILSPKDASLPRLRDAELPDYRT